MRPKKGSLVKQIAKLSYVADATRLYTESLQSFSLGHFCAATQGICIPYIFPVLLRALRVRLKGDLGTTRATRAERSTVHLASFGEETHNYPPSRVWKCQKEHRLLSTKASSRLLLRKSLRYSRSGLLSPEELDDRAFEALQNFNEDAALEVLESSYLRYLVVSGVVLVRFD